MYSSSSMAVILVAALAALPFFVGMAQAQMASDTLYFGGSFQKTKTGGIASKSLIKYNVQSKQFEAVGVASGTINDLHCVNNKLFIGGSNIMGTMDDMDSDELVVYDGTMFTYPASVDGSVIRAIDSGANTNGDQDMGESVVYVGGNLKAIGTYPAANIAQYQTRTWMNVGGGVNGQVNAVKYFNSILFVAGSITTGYNKANPNTDDGTLNPSGPVALHGIGQYVYGGEDMGYYWDALGGGVSNADGSVGTIYELEGSNTNDLYAVGSFAYAGYNNNNGTAGVAKWGTNSTGGMSWQSVGGGITSGEVRTAVYDTRTSSLFIGGSFTITDTNTNNTINNLARFRNGSWAPVGNPNGIVRDLELFNRKLYIGGQFSQIGGISGVSNVAIYDIDANTYDNMNGGLDNQVTAVIQCNAVASGDNNNAPSLIISAGSSSLSDVSRGVIFAIVALIASLRYIFS